MGTSSPEPQTPPPQHTRTSHQSTPRFLPPPKISSNRLPSISWSFMGLHTEPLSQKSCPLISTLPPRLPANPPGLRSLIAPRGRPHPLGARSGGKATALTPPPASARAPAHNCGKSPFSNGRGWEGGGGGRQEVEREAPAETQPRRSRLLMTKQPGCRDLRRAREPPRNLLQGGVKDERRPGPRSVAGGGRGPSPRTAGRAVPTPGLHT